MGYNLFLDDFRMPEDCFEYTHLLDYISEEWVIARNYDEFCKIINENGIPDMISFDHDLGAEHYAFVNVKDIPYDQFTEKTGYHCAKWLLDYIMDNNLDLPKNIDIHTMNISGGQNIKSLFDTYKKVHDSI